MQSSELEQDKAIDIRDYYRFFMRRWKIVVGTTLVGLSLLVTALLTETPLYTASAKILIKPHEVNVMKGGVLNEFNADTTMIASEVLIIKSSNIADRVIKKLGLNHDSEFGGNTPTFKGLVWSNITDFINFLRLTVEDSQKESVEREGLAHIASEFSERVDAKRIGITRVLKVSFTSSDPNKAAKITNAIVGAYIDEQLDAKFNTTRRANLWLGTRLRTLQTKLQESEKLIEHFKIQNNLVGSDNNISFETELESLSEALVIAKTNSNRALEELKNVKAEIKSTGSLVSSKLITHSNDARNLDRQLVEVKEREKELATRYASNDPRVLRAKLNRRSVEQQIKRQAQQLFNKLELDYQTHQQRVALIEKSLKDLKSRAITERSATIRVRELESERAADRAIYEAFLSRLRETTQHETLRTASARVITPAVPPKSTSYPQKKRTLLFGFLGFSALGIGFAFLLELLDNKIKTSEQIEDDLQIHNFSSVPVLGKKDLKGKNQNFSINRYVYQMPLSKFAEAVRTLKIGLQLSSKIGKPPQVILITSALKSEGKSTIASNLALHSAKIGFQTLLIDADLRNPSLTKKFAKDLDAGDANLIQLLTHQTTKEEAIMRDESSLEFLPTTFLEQNSAQLLGSQSMKELLLDLRKTYDLIIIDTSPIGQVVDARVLSSMVDSIAMVIKWNSTPVEIVRKALKTLNAEPEKFGGTILNQINWKQMATYDKIGYTEYSTYYGTGD